MSDDEELLAIFDQYVLPQAPAEWAGELTAEKMREAAQASSTLTRQTLLDAIQKVNDAPHTLCVGGDTHVVHPQARGWTNCAACFAVVDAGGTPKCVTCNIATIPNGPQDWVCPVCGNSMGHA